METDHLIAKVLSGEASGEERQALEQWLQASARNREEFRRLKAFWEQQVTDDETVAREQQRWQKTLGKLEAGHSLPAGPATAKSAVWWKAAAAVALLVAAAAVWFAASNGNFSPQSVAVQPVAWTETIAAKGMRKVLTLPDGTRVKLNSGSVLQVAEPFAQGGQRQVKLQGEAWFDVASDPRRPFSIETTDMEVKVLGTAFTVTAYPQEEKRAVAVLHGKVEVRHRPDREQPQVLVLQKGQMAVREQAGKALQTSGLNEDLVAWKNNVLVINTSNFNEIAASIERWYGVKVQAERAVRLGTGFTGRFENPSLVNLMNSLSYALDIDYNYNKETGVVRIW